MELHPDGKHARIAGIGQKVITELSVGHAEIIKAVEKAGRLGDPRAVALAALAAHNRNVRDGVPQSTHAERQLHVQMVLEKHGIDHQRFVLPEFGRPHVPKDAVSKRDKKLAAIALTREIVKQSIVEVVQARGYFSAEHLREHSLLKAIGKDAPIRYIEKFVDLALKDPKYAGLEKRIFDDKVRYFSKASDKVIAESEKKNILHLTEPLTSFVKVVAEKTREKGQKVVIATVEKATAVVQALAARVVPGEKLPAPTVEITASEIPAFLREHARMSKTLAHAKTLLFRVLYPHRSLEAVEDVYREYRRAKRLARGTTIVVSDGENVPKAHREALERLARRDKAAPPFLADRAPDQSPEAKFKKAAEREKPCEKAKEQTRYEFRGTGRERSDDTPNR
jgi:hypothetical protein